PEVPGSLFVGVALGLGVAVLSPPPEGADALPVGAGPGVTETLPVGDVVTIPSGVGLVEELALSVGDAEAPGDTDGETLPSGSVVGSVLGSSVAVAVIVAVSVAVEVTVPVALGSGVGLTEGEGLLEALPEVEADGLALLLPVGPGLFVAPGVGPG